LANLRNYCGYRVRLADCKWHDVPNSRWSIQELTSLVTLWSGYGHGHLTSVAFFPGRGAEHKAARQCDGAVILGDLIGKLDVLRIECAKCGRSGRYRLADLLMRYGRDEKLFAFTADVTANCTRKQGRNDNDPCGATCPDLPKVV
jgi:hypothetical protein